MCTDTIGCYSHITVTSTVTCAVELGIGTTVKNDNQS